MSLKLYFYDAHVLATDDPVATKVLADIDERHVGELMSLLRYLDPNEAEHFASDEARLKKC